MDRLTFCASALCLSLAAGGAHAAIWDEAIDGDLSTSFLAPPTELGPLSLGSNLLIGSLVDPDTRDHFTFVVAANTQLTQIIWIYDLGVGHGNSGNFFLDGESGRIHGFHSLHYASGSNVLADPLGAGTYSYDIRGAGATTGMESYSLDFRVAAVPLPAAGWLVLGGLAALGLTGRRKRED